MRFTVPLSMGVSPLSAATRTKLFRITDKHSCLLTHKLRRGGLHILGAQSVLLKMSLVVAGLVGNGNLRFDTVEFCSSQIQQRDLIPSLSRRGIVNIER